MPGQELTNHIPLHYEVASSPWTSPSFFGMSCALPHPVLHFLANWEVCFVGKRSMKDQ